MRLSVFFGIITLNILTVTTVNAQKIKVYRDDMDVTSRVAYVDAKAIKSGDYDSFSFECPSFFDTISAMCSRMEVVSDSMAFKEHRNYQDKVKILFESKKQQLILYNSPFFSYNGRFYKINCELFEFYIQFFTVARAVLSVPGSLYTQDCESAKKIRFSIQPQLHDSKVFEPQH